MPGIQRLRIIVRGAVQGVGFRPFIYRLANEYGLTGWVLNSSRGVFIEVEGEIEVLEGFLLRIQRERPARCVIQGLEPSFLDPVGYTEFTIRESEEDGGKIAWILPDIAVCKECLKDTFSMGNRRFMYPFTNCTNCGPRFTIIQKIPYDRPNTTMRGFKMCKECEAEYKDPLDRRFHAQPNACPLCGPQVELWDNKGKPMASSEDAITLATICVKEGQILAMKGIGGFLLIVNALNEGAVGRLRARKRRQEKPFAVMFADLDMIKRYCEISPMEERLLGSPEAPIVLVKARDSNRLAGSCAPGNPYVGAMLPYSPLHHILARKVGSPLVATSGNLSEEPIAHTEEEAVSRLGGIADLLLVHNRPIARPVDDSVARVICGKEQVIRRARGYAPFPIHVKHRLPHLLAVGAYLKNTISLARDYDVFVSQHVGDLETQETYENFLGIIKDLKDLYEIEPEMVVCDMHPDYISTKYAKSLGLPIVEVQHHHAHIVSCMAENGVDGEVLGVAWDGTGYGTDGTVWGGEFLVANHKSFRRVASLDPFVLLGGERAIREPKRVAYILLREVGQEDLKGIFPYLDEIEIRFFQRIIQTGFNCPLTSSVGRLFDGVASILGLRHINTFEAQAAMELEFAADAEVHGFYPFHLKRDKILLIDWRPLISTLVQQMLDGVSLPSISGKFHNTLVEVIVSIAKEVGTQKVVLSGGCFQNRILTERACKRLGQEGFRVYIHQRVPTNDGGISLGQAIVGGTKGT